MGRRNHRKTSQSVQLKKWRPGLYVRISKEDKNSTQYSIENQKKCLCGFVDVNEDEFSGIRFYEDTGHTGTDSDRTAFQLLLQDIQKGIIDCVIVKDLSRLSRNYYEAGYYLEYLFVSMNVRFISLEYPAIDSVKNPDLMNNVMIPMQNVVNDDFCRQTSVKVRNVLDMKRKRGEFIGAFAPYGYEKNPLDHHHLVVDEEAACVVRMVFRWFVCDGISQIKIAQRLNDLGILNPTAYKQSKGHKYQNSCREFGSSYWHQSVIKRILENPMYIGNMVQGRQRVKSFKYRAVEVMPKEDWIIVENTHKAVIDRTTFEKVQDLLARDTRTAPGKPVLYTFSGFLHCADCKRAMHRKPDGKYTYYICRTYTELSKKACTRHSIREEKLKDTVFSILKLHIRAIPDTTEIISALQSPSAKTKNNPAEVLLKSRQRKLRRIRSYQKSLYEDWKNGGISEEEYLYFKQQYTEEIKQTESGIKQLKTERQSCEDIQKKECRQFNFFKQHLELDEINRDILSELIDVIYIEEGGDLTVRFKFSDPFIQ